MRKLVEVKLFIASTAQTMQPTPKFVNFRKFFDQYHGHPIADLETIVSTLRILKPEGKIIYLVGDSSLDNKFWFPESESYPALNGYEDIFLPPRYKADISYWMNRELTRRGLGTKYTVVNCAVEESRLASRDQSLLNHDLLVSKHLQDGDVIVCSVGGNDVALQPNFMTMLSMLFQIYLPALGLGRSYFRNLFGSRTESYVRRIIGHSQVSTPRKITAAICMIYYPDEKMTGSWADTSLAVMRYNSAPGILQSLIRQTFEEATCKIGTLAQPLNTETSAMTTVQFVPVPLYEALDGKNSADYVARVEPSATGGSKMASLIVDKLFPNTIALRPTEE